MPSMAAPSTLSDVLQGRSDAGEPKSCIPAEDMRWIEDYVWQCNNGAMAISPSVTQLRRLHEVLTRALCSSEALRTGEAVEFVKLCNFLPGVIKRTVGGDIAAGAVMSLETNFQGYMLEVLCAVAELSVETLSSQAEAVPPSFGTGISQLLEALSIALDSGSPYYELRRKTSMSCANVVLRGRLALVLEVPGFLVRVDGVADEEVHYFCSSKGVNQTGKTCECCKPPMNADAVLVYLHWLLAKTSSGSGYEYVLKILSSPKQLTLPNVALLLRPLGQLSQLNTSSNTWRDGYLQHMEANFKTTFKDCFNDMCSSLLQYLNDVVPEMAPLPCPSQAHVGLRQALFITVINDIHRILCWGLYYGRSPELDVVRDSLRKLQETVCERLLDARRDGAACYSRTAYTFVEAAIQASLAPVANYESLFSLKWLEEKNIIWKLLHIRFRVKSVPKVKQFLTTLAKRGVIMKEKEFLKYLYLYAERPPVPPVTNEECNAADLICLTMLEVLDISAYSDNFLEPVLEWMEARKVADSVILGSRIFSLVRKLLKSDKNRRWKERFCTLLRTWATDVPSSLLVECLSEVAIHYNSSDRVTGSFKDSFQKMDEERAKLLQDCSSADMVTSRISRDMTNGALKHTKIYIQKIETWKDKEIDQLNASPKLTKALSTTLPYTRHETAKDCLERLDLAQHLSTDLNPNESNAFASVLATTMSSELQTLKALKYESSLLCKVVQQIEELNEKHMCEYDDFRQEQYQRLVKFAEACRKEKDDVIWDALNEKAKLLASVERACVGKDKVMSSEDILKRLFVNTEGAFKQMEVKLTQVEDKHKESLERLPNFECVVCFSEFSLKRKRACLDPCGHASACVDCATQEWKRTKSCSVCKASIEKPIPVPSKLFF